ncbi:putative Glycosyl transferase [Sulfurovum sp. enrichment culture clone C5]|uniref:Putative Glycosyl transferase n=1 Tax=Sulfurovum sp. enrichment culture clone C5 TaxID=497650 RepID=A0A0S4XQ56_9BACT|nr:putative Glycosyl transferase [Sulfurovum sp. enrichment culture clone C5]
MIDNQIKIPKVSIFMITYNHEKYIAKALDSILMQEVDFDYEIVVGEDYSKDNTREILLSYKSKYPDKFKLLLHDKNIGMMPNVSATLRACTGKYIALLEGDDYWTDLHKLQIQIDAMEEHPNCHMSFHPVSLLKNDKIGKKLCQHSDENKIFTTSEVILGGGGFCSTPSLVLKQEVISNLPEFFHQKAPVGDYFLQILGSVSGGALYIDRTMAIARTGHEGSWTVRTHRSKISKSIEERNKIFKKQEKDLSNYIEALDDLNIYLDQKYTNEISHAKAGILFGLGVLYLKYKYYNEYKNAIEKSYKTYKLKSINFVILYNFRHFPKTIYFIRKIGTQFLQFLGRI